jgi:hypothetical protein
MPAELRAMLAEAQPEAQPEAQRDAQRDAERVKRPPPLPGVGYRGLEILARSIYRDLRERGCTRTDVIRLATALLDQLIAS